MKKTELLRKTKELDYKMDDTGERTKLRRKDGIGKNLIAIGEVKKNDLYIETNSCDEKDLEMLEVAIQYAGTDPDER